jgi:hypothetical protein
MKNSKKQSGATPTKQTKDDQPKTQGMWGNNTGVS